MRACASYDAYFAHVLTPLWLALSHREFELDVLSCEGVPSLMGRHLYPCGPTHI